MSLENMEVDKDPIVSGKTEDIVKSLEEQTKDEKEKKVEAETRKIAEELEGELENIPGEEDVEKKIGEILE